MEIKRARWLIVAVLLSAACDTQPRSGAIFPLAATPVVAPVTPVVPVTPVAPVAPVVPRPPGVGDVTSIAVGEVRTPDDRRISSGMRRVRWVAVPVFRSSLLAAEPSSSSCASIRGRSRLVDQGRKAST